MRRLLTLGAILVAGLVAQGASAATAGPVLVQKVQIGNVGNFVLYVPTGTGPTCPESGSQFFMSVPQSGPPTADGLKASLTVLLTALTSNKTIVFDYDPVTCAISSVMILR